MGASILPALKVVISAKKYFKDDLAVQSETRTVEVKDDFTTEEGWVRGYQRRKSRAKEDECQE